MDGPYEDALSALINLGYRAQDAKEALKRATKADDRLVGAEGAHS